MKIKNNDLNKNNEKVINNIIFKFSETKYPAYSYLKSFKKPKFISLISPLRITIIKGISAAIVNNSTKTVIKFKKAHITT